MHTMDISAINCYRIKPLKLIYSIDKNIVSLVLCDNCYFKKWWSFRIKHTLMKSLFLF